MAKKIIGYAQLTWICPNCKTVNKGNEKTCVGCGAPQPVDVQFQQPEQQVLLKDEAEISQAKAGADIHCGFCGTRNPANAKVCSQCGSDLSLGNIRQSGAVVGAFTGEKVAEDWTCQNCGSINLGIHTHCTACGATKAAPSAPIPPAAVPLTPQAKKRNWVLPAIVIAVLVIIVFFVIFALTRKQDFSGYVSGTEWKRLVQIETFGVVSKEGWADQIPSAADVGSCELKFRREQDQPAAQSTEVCGTPYMLDLGNGNAEVSQDCTYRVYEEYCNYSINDWQVSDTLESTGMDLNPQWPAAQLATNQRVGDQSEVYTIQFNTDNGDYEYATHSLDEYLLFTPGSRWILTINAFNNISAVETAP